MKKALLLLLLFFALCLIMACNIFEDENSTEILESDIAETEIKTGAEVADKKEQDPKNEFAIEISTAGGEVQRVEKDFLHNETLTRISFCKQEGWEVESREATVGTEETEGSPDWGFLIFLEGKNEASCSVFGQHGTLSVERLYPNRPETFTTESGMNALLYMDKILLEDNTYLIEG